VFRKVAPFTALRFIRWRNRFAPCGFAELLLCLAPRIVCRAVTLSPRLNGKHARSCFAPARDNSNDVRGLRPR
jgi:hypothetical protein